MKNKQQTRKLALKKVKVAHLSAKNSPGVKIHTRDIICLSTDYRTCTCE